MFGTGFVTVFLGTLPFVKAPEVSLGRFLGVPLVVEPVVVQVERRSGELV
jgi:hypothetical protein